MQVDALREQKLAVTFRLAAHRRREKIEDRRNRDGAADVEDVEVGLQREQGSERRPENRQRGRENFAEVRHHAHPAADMRRRH